MHDNACASHGASRPRLNNGAALGHGQSHQSDRHPQLPYDGAGVKRSQNPMTSLDKGGTPAMVRRHMERGLARESRQQCCNLGRVTQKAAGKL